MDVFIIIILLIYFFLDAPATVEKVNRPAHLTQQCLLYSRKKGCKRHAVMLQLYYTLQYIDALDQKYFLTINY